TPVIPLDRRPLDKAGVLELRDELGHARNRHPFDRGQLAHADPRPRLDLDEEPDLASGDAERVDLAPQLAVELQEHRSEPVGELDRIERHERSEHFVNQVNESGSALRRPKPSPEGQNGPPWPGTHSKASPGRFASGSPPAAETPVTGSRTSSTRSAAQSPHGHSRSCRPSSTR